MAGAVGARCTAVLAVVVFALVTPSALRGPAGAGGQSAVAGVLDITATTLLLVAVRAGLTATVAPVAALAPGFTVGHARWYLHEKTSRTPDGRRGRALVGLVLITTG